MAAGTCKYCGCTDDAACEGGCRWTDASKTVCSTCAVVVDVVQQLVEMFGVVVKTPKAKLAARTAPRWDALTPENQQLLVMSSHAIVEGMREALLIGPDIGCAPQSGADRTDLRLLRDAPHRARRSGRKRSRMPSFACSRRMSASASCWPMVRSSRSKGRITWPHTLRT
jgi:hypothetical protein